MFLSFSLAYTYFVGLALAFIATNPIEFHLYVMFLYWWIISTANRQLQTDISVWYALSCMVTAVDSTRSAVTNDRLVSASCKADATAGLASLGGTASASVTRNLFYTPFSRFGFRAAIYWVPHIVITICSYQMAETKLFYPHQLTLLSLTWNYSTPTQFFTRLIWEDWECQYLWGASRSMSVGPTRTETLHLVRAHIKEVIGFNVGEVLGCSCAPIRKMI